MASSTPHITGPAEVAHLDSTPDMRRTLGPKGSRRPEIFLIFVRPWRSGRAEAYRGAESFASAARASCTVVMNWAGKMMVEFFSIEISAMVCSVRS